MDQTSEQVPSASVAQTDQHRVRRCGSWRGEAEGAVALDSLVVISALPAIQRDLGADLQILDWTVNAYELAAAAGIITAAALGDRLGRRRVFAVGIVVFTAASAACALAPNVEFLIAARAVQGIGASIVTPLSLAILASIVPAHLRGTAMGIWGGLAGLAIAGGPLIGGAVTQGFAWHMIFWLNVPVGIVAVLLVLLRLPETRGTARPLDLRGAALVAAAASALTWGLVRAGTIGWAAPEVLVSLVVGSLLLAAFVAWERRVGYAVVPHHFFRIRSFAGATVAGFLLMAAVFGAAFLISQHLQGVLRLSPLEAGLGFLPMTATPLVVAPLAGV